MRGTHRGPQMVSNAENVPIWWRHHVSDDNGLAFLDTGLKNYEYLTQSLFIIIMQARCIQCACDSFKAHGLRSVRF